MDDEEIVRGIKKQSKIAFSSFVDVYGGFIKSVVGYHLSTFLDLRGECVNDVLLSVWQHIDSFDPKRNTFKNWVGAISRYKAIDYKRKYYKELTNEELNEFVPDGRAAFENDINDDINNLLACLNPEDREIFKRHYLIGESVSEMSRDMGKKEGYFFNRLSRGRKKIRALVERSDYL